MVIDLAFEGKMTDPEVRSLCSQLMYSYGANKRAAQPCLLYLTSLAVRGDQSRRSLLARVCSLLPASVCRKASLALSHARDKMLYSLRYRRVMDCLDRLLCMHAASHDICKA